MSRGSTWRGPTSRAATRRRPRGLGPGYRPAPRRPLGGGDRLRSRRSARVRPGGGAARTCAGSAGRPGPGPGSASTSCSDGRRPPRRLASDHRGVAEAVRNGWADAGVCLRLVSEEAGLGFPPGPRGGVRPLLPRSVRRDDPGFRPSSRRSARRPTARRWASCPDTIAARPGELRRGAIEVHVPPSIPMAQRIPWIRCVR